MTHFCGYLILKGNTPVKGSFALNNDPESGYFFSAFSSIK